MLGFNPGGDPRPHPETVQSSLANVAASAAGWSAYHDEPWRDGQAGTSPFQRRVKHLLETQLGTTLRQTPSSNLIFKRSSRLADLGDWRALETACWPFHQAVIDTLQPTAVICLGVTTGRSVRRRLEARELLDQHTEGNGRKWRSQAHRNADGLIVFSLTHPSIADWTSEVCDPSPMIKRVLRRYRR